MAIVVGGGGASSGGSGAISGGFKIFELMFNQTTDAALPAGTYRAAIFQDKAAMQAYFTKHTTEFDRLKASGRVCEIGTIDAQGKPLTINNEAYSYVEGETDPWVDVVGGLVGPKGDKGDKGDSGDAASKVSTVENSVSTDELTTKITLSNGEEIESSPVTLPSGGGGSAQTVMFTSVDSMKSYFSSHPQELKTNLPIMVSRVDSDTVGDAVENDVLLLQWTGEDSPESFDENLLVGASLMAGVSSLSLGEAHTFSSGGQNVFTINQISKSAFTSPWSEIGDHSTEAGRYVNSRPKSREYGELEYPEIAGSVADSGAVDYNVSGENPENQSLLGIELVAAEDYTGRLSYDIKEEDTGKLVYKQTFNVDVSEGDTIDWWFNFPVDSIAGDKATAELLKADRSYMKVRPVSGGSEAYRKLKRRKFDIKELAYVGEGGGGDIGDEIRVERVIDKDNESNRLNFNVNNVMVLEADHELSVRSSDRITYKVQDADKFIISSGENDSFNDLNMNSFSVKNVKDAEDDTSAPNFGQVKKFVSEHTGGRHEILVKATDQVTGYQVGPAEVSLDHVQLFTVTSENAEQTSGFQFTVPLDDSFETGSIIEFSKRYYKGNPARVYYFNNREGEFFTHTLDDKVYAIQKGSGNGWDVIDEADVPTPDEAIGWVGDNSGVHGHVLYADADDGSTANSDSEVTIASIKAAQTAGTNNTSAIENLTQQLSQITQTTVDNGNEISNIKGDINSQFEFDHVTTLEVLGISDDDLHSHHGDKTSLAKVFKTGKVRDGNKYLLTLNMFEGKDLHGFLPNNQGGVLQVSSVNSFAQRDHEMDYYSGTLEHRVLFEYIDKSGKVWNAYLSKDDTFVDFTESNVPSDLSTILQDLRNDVDSNGLRITGNAQDIDGLEATTTHINTELSYIESVLPLSYVRSRQDLSITDQQLNDANGDHETIARLFRDATFYNRKEYTFSHALEKDDLYFGLLDSNNHGGILTFTQYELLEATYSQFVFTSEDGFIQLIIDLDDNFVDWVSSTGSGDAALRQEFEAYKQSTDEKIGLMESSINTLTDTIQTLNNVVDNAFRGQSLTYSNNILTSTMTSVDGNTHDATVTIVGGGGGEIPETFKVYVGWTEDLPVDSVQIKNYLDTENARASYDVTRDTLLSTEFTINRSITEWRYPYIAFPKGAVDPDPTHVSYLENSPPADWQSNEFQCDGLTYIALRPAYANNVTEIKMTLINS